MCSSCTAPCIRMATRVSCGVMFTRISSTASNDIAKQSEQFRGLEQGQAHHPGVTAVDSGDKGGGASLDCVGAGLVQRFAAHNVALDLVGRKLAHGHDRTRHAAVNTLVVL